MLLMHFIQTTKIKDGFPKSLYLVSIFFLSQIKTKFSSHGIFQFTVIKHSAHLKLVDKA